MESGILPASGRRILMGTELRSRPPSEERPPPLKII